MDCKLNESFNIGEKFYIGHEKPIEYKTFISDLCLIIFHLEGNVELLVSMIMLLF